MVTVFPILNEDDARKYFDENIVDDRILAAYLSITNKTADNIHLAASDLKLGEIIIPSSTSDLVYNSVKRAYGMRAFLWTITTYGVGGVASALHTRNINEEIEADLKEREIKKTIDPMGSSQGFIWFKVSDDVISEAKGFPKGMVLSLTIEMGAEKKLTRYDFPILP